MQLSQKTNSSESLSQTTKINMPTIPPKPPENNQADPSIINMIP
jgi:hypothetical protein